MSERTVFQPSTGGLCKHCRQYDMNHDYWNGERNPVWRDGEIEILEVLSKPEQENLPI